MKNKLYIFLLIFTLFIPYLNSQSRCELKYYINPISFYERVKVYRDSKDYDAIINILNKEIEKDSSEIWPYYQMACIYSLKEDTITPFNIIYNKVNLIDFGKDILTDTDLELLYQTKEWEKLKSKIDVAYLSKYPNITNPKLSLKLWHMGIEDQRYRTLNNNNKGVYNNKPLGNKHERFVDSLMNIDIIPTYSMVGKEASDVFLLIIDHNHNFELFEKLLAKIQNLLIKKELSTDYYAMTYDRYVINKGQKQLYGTQVLRYLIKDDKNNIIPASDGFIVPVEDVKNLNKRRKELGLDSIEEMSKRMDARYDFIYNYDYLPVNEAYAKMREITGKQKTEMEEIIKIREKLKEYIDDNQIPMQGLHQQQYGLACVVAQM